MEAKPSRPGSGLQRGRAIVVMGVAGCGKTEVGIRLAAAIGGRFIEGDRLHPPENVARMSRGEPLNDELRAGWLDAVGRAVHDAMLAGGDVVASCSALKRIYRDRLRRSEPSIVFVHLVISREEALRRVAGRKGHFMPASLVDDQFATLEPPGADECALAVDGEMSLDGIVLAVSNFLGVERSGRAE